MPHSHSEGLHPSDLLGVVELLIGPIGSLPSPRLSPLTVGRLCQHTTTVVDAVEGRISHRLAGEELLPSDLVKDHLRHHASHRHGHTAC